jgi:hypothetical protein
VVFEHTEFRSASVRPDGVELSLAPARGAPLALGDTNRPTAVEALRGGGGTGGGGAAPAGGNGAAAHLNGSGNGAAHNGAGANGSAAAAAPGARQRAQEQAEGKPWKLRARLMLDCMGHYSPVVKQIRGGSRPGCAPVPVPRTPLALLP